jgi:hypothetical protein
MQSYIVHHVRTIREEQEWALSEEIFRVCSYKWSISLLFDPSIILKIIFDSLIVSLLLIPQAP